MTESSHPAPLPEGFAVRAEMLLRASAETDSGLSVYFFDGLLEWIEWANQGYESDPTACVWLGGLRWWRAQRGTLPDGAPPVPPRWIDEQSVLETVFGGDAERNLRALDSDQMPTLRDPAHPGDDGPRALSRSAIYALVPGLEDHLIVSLARQGAALTQGEPAAWEASCAAAVIIADLLYSAHDGDSTDALVHAVHRAVDVLEAEPAAPVRALLTTALEKAQTTSDLDAVAWPDELVGSSAPVVLAAAAYASAVGEERLEDHPEEPESVSVLVRQLRAARGREPIIVEGPAAPDLVSVAVERWVASIT
ncbi:ADP-ribosylglycohydrolase family protein [Citricoccus muralis]|uniref:ADP-ribosylglycohydrolase family protein n=1 Tax=Citricoccus muralis TaxID=169134 RepID=A0ABY8HAM5_9MICC|nr:ADP-ribosylglycohydrolase family protein [Citricoccus muralis]WFP17713.1 ADP-ribosylglycohydrolase family protein [Citricoccus muralis]